MCAMHLIILFIGTNAHVGWRNKLTNRFARKATIPTANAEDDLEKGLWYDVEKQNEIKTIEDTENNDVDSFFEAEEYPFEENDNEGFFDAEESVFEEYEDEDQDLRERVKAFIAERNDEEHVFEEYEDEDQDLRERVKAFIAEQEDLEEWESLLEEWVPQTFEDEWIIEDSTKEGREFASELMILQDKAKTNVESALDQLPDWLNRKNVAKYAGGIYSFVYGPETSRKFTRIALGTSGLLASWITPMIAPIAPILVELITEEVGAAVKRNKLAVGKDLGERFGGIVITAVFDIVSIVSNFKFERRVMVEVFILLGKLILSFAKEATMTTINLFRMFVHHVGEHVGGIRKEVGMKFMAMIQKR